MRAVFLLGGREAVVREIEVPRPGDGEVLLAMKAAGLCGSDLHMHYRIAPENRRGVVFGLRTDPDVVPGHEPGLGVVAEVGAGVWHLEPGDRVAVHHMAGCGVGVECRRGWDINCQHKWGTYGLDHPGAMQDFMVVRARDCVRVPDSVSLAEAAYYTCGAGTGYLALKRAGFGLGGTSGRGTWAGRGRRSILRGFGWGPCCWHRHARRTAPVRRVQRDRLHHESEQR